MADLTDAQMTGAAEAPNVALPSPSGGSVGVPGNNPTNIRPLTNGQTWKGQTGIQHNGIASFDNIGDSWAAADKNFLAKIQLHKLFSLRSILGDPTWGWDQVQGPTPAYAGRIAASLGVSPDDPSVGLKALGDAGYRHSILEKMANMVENPGFNLSFGQGPSSASPSAPTSSGDLSDEDMGLNAASSASSGGDQSAPQGPIYDPINRVQRDPKTGDILAVGPPNTVGSDNSININSSANPKVIADWKLRHPLDLSNQTARLSAPPTPPAQTGDLMDAFNQASFGLKQGVGDVAGSLGDLKARLANINPLLGSIAGGYESPQALNAQAGARVFQRNQADTAMNGNPYYGLGQLGGQVAGTLPIMAMTGGLGDAAEAASAGSKLGPLAEFLAGRSGGLARMPSLMASGAAQGAEANVLASGGSQQTLPQQAASGAVTGAALAPVAPVAGYALGKLLAARTPQLSANVQDLADKAVNKYGMPVTGLQIRGANGDTSAAVRWSNGLSEAGTGFHVSNLAQHDAWTKAIGDTFGGDGAGLPVADLGPGTLGPARRRIGAAIGNFANGTTVQDTGPLVDNLNAIQQDVEQTPMGEGGTQALLNQIANTRAAIAADGTLSGTDYQTIIRHNGPLSLSQQSRDPAVSMTAGRIRDALDEAVASSAPPEQQAQFRLAQSQYKNLNTVARAARNADVEGQVSPGALNNAVNVNFKNRAFTGAANTGGDLGELADIGRTFLTEPPNSYTAPRLASMAKNTALAAGIGAGGGELFTQHPDVALKLAALGALGGSAKFGMNLGRGVLGGAGAGAMMVNNPDPTSAILAALQGSNDNLVPTGVLAIKQAQRANQ